MHRPAVLPISPRLPSAVPAALWAKTHPGSRSKELSDHGTRNSEIPSGLYFAFRRLRHRHKKVSDIIEEQGLAQVSDDSALEKIADEVLAANEKSVNDYKGGKTNALGYLVGQCMKASKGKANPGKMKEIILAKLG